jgi:hypothetical protein
MPKSEPLPSNIPSIDLTSSPDDARNKPARKRKSDEMSRNTPDGRIKRRELESPMDDEDGFTDIDSVFATKSTNVFPKSPRVRPVTAPPNSAYSSQKSPSIIKKATPFVYIHEVVSASLEYSSGTRSSDTESRKRKVLTRTESELQQQPSRANKRRVVPSSEDEGEDDDNDSYHSFDDSETLAAIPVAPVEKAPVANKEGPDDISRANQPRRCHGKSVYELACCGARKLWSSAGL